MLALHLLQSALVYINTIFLQVVLAGSDWADRPTERTGADSGPCSGRT